MCAIQNVPFEFTLSALLNKHWVRTLCVLEGCSLSVLKVHSLSVLEVRMHTLSVLEGRSLSVLEVRT